MEAVKLDLYKDFGYNNNTEIANGIFWVGYADKIASLCCNSYLITDHDEAVLIDSGSRDGFSSVMLKIMRTGFNPKNIIRLIYQHYDPDLCGNLPQMESLIKNDRLAVLSHIENNIFIDFYSTKTKKECISQQDFRFAFSSGRRLEFIQTPYAHTLGSFMTYDSQSKILFSSDIFGCYDSGWGLRTNIDESCADCEPGKICPIKDRPCQVSSMVDFHKRIMSSKKALRYALKKIDELDISIIAPQHGSLLHTPVSQRVCIDRLKSLSRIGIENYIQEEQAQLNTLSSSGVENYIREEQMQLKPLSGLGIENYFREEQEQLKPLSGLGVENYIREEQAQMKPISGLGIENYIRGEQAHE